MGSILIFRNLARNNIFTADVESVFLNVDDIVDNGGLCNFGTPNGDMDRRVQRMIGWKLGQVLRMKKPAFEDDRAPELWNKNANNTVGKLDFRTQRLDNCLYLSVRQATEMEDKFVVIQEDEQRHMVDGIHEETMTTAMVAKKLPARTTLSKWTSQPADFVDNTRSLRQNLTLVNGIFDQSISSPEYE